MFASCLSSFNGQNASELKQDASTKNVNSKYTNKSGCKKLGLFEMVEMDAIYNCNLPLINAQNQPHNQMTILIDTITQKVLLHANPNKPRTHGQLSHMEMQRLLFHFICINYKTINHATHLE